MIQNRSTWPRRSFGRRQPSAVQVEDREDLLAQRAARAMDSARATAGMACTSIVVMGAATGQAVQKDRPLRSEEYRRLVAALPCIHCGIAGISQCAHANTGKGVGIKASDLDSFPLCACQPGRRGCHSIFDQGAMFSKQERKARECVWVAQTQKKIISTGQWPQKLAMPSEFSIEGLRA
ncbi:hypothetical protein [Delftia acidovorans]|uniref:hypothetical protein n=1 Tax=Delftia acidovorans TaxID=80866 RepID=UPI003D151959